MTESLAASLITIVGVWGLTVLSPGPNFLAASHAASSDRTAAGIAVALGIGLGTLVWASASLMGLALLFQEAQWLYHGVRIAGAAFLILLGFRLILSTRNRTNSTADAPPASRRVSLASAFRRGFLVDLSNPKAAAFFTSLFAVSMPPNAPLWFDIVVIVLVVAIAAGWYAAVAMAMGRPSVSAIYRKAQRAINRLAGVLFIGLGAKLAADR